ncbi:hypothetical protein [Pseudomonas sp. PONIH3]|uniref:hypothetical protein n=1 Tax=Pseudomonas sp. PONIH3 TaxID=1636610 RepID=UPI003D2A12FB
MHLIFIFLKPYYWFAHIAAYGIAQNLEGVSYFGWLNNIYDPRFPLPLLNLDPSTGVKIIAGAIYLLLAPLACVLVRGGFILGRKPGLAMLAAVLLPGALSLLGSSAPLEFFIPDEFHFGTGYIGGFWSNGANYIIAFMWGWATIMLVANLFKSQKFKHAYDHIWCLLTIVGCMYLVVDSQAKSHEEHKIETNALIGKHLEFYKERYSALNILCHKEPSIFANAKLICDKARILSTSLPLEIERSEPEFRRYGDSWMEDILSDTNIEQLNSYFCSNDKLIAHCKETPIDLLITGQELFEKVLVPISGHTNRLKELYKKLNTYTDKVTRYKEYTHLKYFLFCLICFISGGKAATSSISFIGESNMKSRSWARRIAAVTFFNLWFAIMLVTRADDGY